MMLLIFFILGVTLLILAIYTLQERTPASLLVSSLSFIIASCLLLAVDVSVISAQDMYERLLQERSNIIILNSEINNPRVKDENLEYLADLLLNKKIKYNSDLIHAKECKRSIFEKYVVGDSLFIPNEVLKLHKIK